MGGGGGVRGDRPVPLDSVVAVGGGEEAGERREPSPPTPTRGEIGSRSEAGGGGGVAELLLRVVTWNQQARPPPGSEDLIRSLFPPGGHHVVAVGCQECENTFSRSVISPLKARWERALKDAVGTDYGMVRSHSLQATHM